MFDVADRERLRARLLEDAAADPRITGAAITGSAAESREDRWSDIDLAFGLAADVPVSEAVAAWSARMYSEHGAVHHLDVPHGPWLYRVFLLESTLQVDLAFVPETGFRALAPSFQLVSGTARDPAPVETPAVEGLIGFGWLYALHARSCIARGKRWQAEYMISGVRDTAMALACVRCGLPAVHGRGVDRLADGIARQFEEALVRGLDPAELTRAFQAAMERLIAEVRLSGFAEAGGLEPVLRGIMRG